MPPDRLDPGFVREGRCFALPLAVAAECDPIDPAASYLRALTLASDGGSIFATTEGSACHVVRAALLGAVGYVLDLGVIPGATALPCLAAWSPDPWYQNILVAAHHADGSRLWLTWSAQPLDTIQEPTFGTEGFSCVAEMPGSLVVDCLHLGDAVFVLSDRGLACWTDAGLRWLIEDRPRFTGVVPRLLPLRDGAVGWITAAGAFEVWAAGAISCRTRLPRPPGAGAIACAYGAGAVVCAADGETWSIDPEQVRPLGRTVLAPVQALAALADGRIYACCGEGIAHGDCFEPAAGRWRDLGAFVASLPQPRYGLAFAAALAGPHGEIWLAEHDRGGCLWLFHPCWPAPHPRSIA